MMPLRAASGTLARAVRALSTAAGTAGTVRDIAPVPSRLAGFEGPTVFCEFTGLANEVGAVNLGQGAPEWGPPSFVKHALEDTSMDDTIHQYTRSAGHPLLVETLADVYGTVSGRAIDPMAEVAVTVGATGAIYSSIQALVEHGDEVVALEPAYDSYEPAVRAAGGIMRRVPLRVSTPTPGATGPRLARDAITLDLDELRKAITDKTRVLILNTPHNPTGRIITQAEMEEIATMVAATPRCVVLTDEVYEAMTYDHGDDGGFIAESVHTRFADIPGMWDRSLTISSIGKTFSNTGWKIGWVIGPAELVERVVLVNQWTQFCVASPLQVATAASLQSAMRPHDGSSTYFASLRKDYRHQRDTLVDILQDVGLTPIVPDGGFFVFADTSAFEVPERFFQGQSEVAAEITRDWAFARWLTHDAGVTCIPPSAFFGPATRPLAANLARFAFCKHERSLIKAGKRLRKWKATL